MTNIKFEYLFRDENNYKEYGEVIYSNPSKLSLKLIKKHIKENLIEDLWFYPDNWEIPKFSFHRISNLGTNKHLWYEFVAITETKRDITSIAKIEELIVNVKNRLT